MDQQQIESELSVVRDFLDRIVSVERDTICGKWAMRHARSGIAAIDRLLGRNVEFDPIRLGC